MIRRRPLFGVIVAAEIANAFAALGHKAIRSKLRHYVRAGSFRRIRVIRPPKCFDVSCRSAVERMIRLMWRRCWIVWCGLWLGQVFAQISPGPLSRAHHDLEGPTKCASCHTFGLGERGLKCLDCHTEIRKRIEAKRGYHARAFNASRGSMDCARCHLEHNGQQFQITKLDKANFNHNGLTDFPLLGKHKALTCETCHDPTALRPPFAAK